MSRQGKLGDWSDDEALEESDPGIRKNTIAYRFAPDNAEPNDELSCPWCLGSSDDFKVTTEEDINGRLPGDSRQVSCENCSAVIPTEADWYLRGEKICLK